MYAHRITERRDAWLKFEIVRPEGQDPDEVYARGTLKWDGCVNWETHPDCMMHNCGISDLREFTACFERLYAEAYTEYPDVLMDLNEAQQQALLNKESN